MYMGVDGGRKRQIYSGVSQNQSRTGVEWKEMCVMAQRRNTRPANRKRDKKE
ncbi:hypothetical protein BDQ94DRAFT_136727 [Aspergillus welwitschiae]|uniref:Uncharacterized protein n=1 Tax=Aspergillus welwitschiae TaxID=1341132 RepID=A0A3F3QEZ8_9EURO|nr:hypothetical protein BDQ94DRAFT_136727 [Aspergillus welwitschiae]RDH37610.1 hypothetical protein BDQ94DRAFT_136727 [Aspergillus welwitschiae]